MNKMLTIFTPAYNRAKLLHKLYDSLVRQIDTNFNWVIVDDGSTDNTQDVVNAFKKEGRIDITYIKQENGGKMQAHNAGVLACKTEFFMCVDSDDYLIDDAVLKLNKQIPSLLADNTLAGCIYYRGKDEKNPLTESRFPDKERIKIGKLYDDGFFGDTSILLKTEILKQYLFPKIEGEKFFPEEYLYLQIDKNYDYKLDGEIIIICEYQADGYTKNALNTMVKNIKGVCLSIDYKISSTKKLIVKIKNIIRYIGFSKLANYKDAYNKSNHKFLYIIFYLFGLMYYNKKKRILHGQKN